MSDSAVKSVLYISYDGMTDPLGQSQVLPYLKGLSNRGHRITILSCEKQRGLRDLRAETAAALSAHGIEWHFIPYSKRPPVVSTGYDLSRMYRRAARLVREDAFDIVHCRTVLSTLIGHRLKTRFGIKLVFDMRGFWADERVEGDLWNLSNPVYGLLYKFFKGKERRYFREADHVIALTERAKAVIEDVNEHSATRPPVKVIPCCVDLDHFSGATVDENHVRARAAKLGLDENDFVVIYLGSLGTRYMLREMLEFFAEVAGARENARFLFVTRDEHERITALAEEVGIDPGRILITSSTYDEVPSLIRLADVAVFFIKTGFSAKAVSPTKQAELLGMGVPLVCNAGIGDCDRLIAETGAGLVLEELARKGYVEVAGQLDRLVEIPGPQLRAVAERFFSLESAVVKYDSVSEAL